MKKAGNKSVKLISAIAMTAFSVLTTAMASLAWFTSMRMQESGANNFQVADSSDIKIEDIKFFGYDDDVKSGILLENIGSINEPYLPDYDSFIKERNRYSNRIFRVEMSFPSGVSTSKSLTLSIPCDHSEIVRDSKIAAYLSNIISFKGVLAETINTSSVSSYDANVYSGGAFTAYSFDGKNYTYDQLGQDAGKIYSYWSAFFTSKSENTFVTAPEIISGRTSIDKSKQRITMPADLPVVSNTTRAIYYGQFNYSGDLITQYENSQYMITPSIGSLVDIEGNKITFAGDMPYFLFGVSQ